VAPGIWDVKLNYRRVGIRIDYSTESTTVYDIPTVVRLSVSRLRLRGVIESLQRVAGCVVKQYFRYTAGRLEHWPTGRSSEAVEEFRKSQFQFQELMFRSPS